MTDVTLVRVSDLSPAQWRFWIEIIEASDGLYKSPYFRPEFVRAVAAVRGDVEVALLHQAGQPIGFFPFQRGQLGLGKPVGGKLSDYHGPLLRSGVEIDPQQLIRACKLASWDFDHLVCATAAFEPFVALRDRSPQLDLSGGYEAYSQGRRDAGSDTIVRTGQKGRKLAREVGPLQLDFDVDDAEAYELMRSWKSAQYERTGLADLFGFSWTGELLNTLRQNRGSEFSAPLSVLRAGDKIAAVVLSLRARDVLHVWFPAYNPELSNYSPGLVVLLKMAELAPGLGIRTIDLGRGDERYKWSLASTSAEVCEGTVACPSLGTWLRNRWRQTRDWVNNSSLKQTAAIPGRLLKPVRQWMAYR